MRFNGQSVAFLNPRSMSDAGFPLGFDASDANLYRYVNNDPSNHTDPSGLEVAGMAHFYPLALGGSYNQMVFELTEAEHTAAHNVLRRHKVARVPGVDWDMARDNWSALTAAQRRAIIVESMQAANIPQSMIDRHIGNIMSDCKAGANRSPGRPTWYRAAQTIRSPAIQQARAAAPTTQVGAPRATGLQGARTPARAGGNIRSTTVRALGVYSVYSTLTEALAAAQFNDWDLEAAEGPYHFVANDGSIFIVENPTFTGHLLAGLAGIGSRGIPGLASSRVRFVAGPREGQTENISDADAAAFQAEAESLWGKYEPGGYFGGATFTPGTNRSSITIYNEWRQETGYIDANGRHNYSAPRGVPHT